MTADTRYYLAYGSNLHPLRLSLRIPGAGLVASRVELNGCQLVFHKRGQDESGKCSLQIESQACCYGTLYCIPAEALADLDRWEGGYERRGVRLRLGSRTLDAFTYLAQAELVDDRLSPFDWYRALVRAGAQFQGFPRDYLRTLEQTPVRFDQDPQRSALHQQLLKQLLDYNRLYRTPSLPGASLLEWC